jgi:uncharacterized membrane protein
VNANDAGVASSLVNVAQQVGGSIGLAVIGTVAWTGVAGSLRSQAAAAHSAGASTAEQIHDHALATGFSKGYVVSAGIMVLAAIIAVVVIRLRREDLSGEDPTLHPSAEVSPWR